jgi:hypothetical protein
VSLAEAKTHRVPTASHTIIRLPCVNPNPHMKPVQVHLLGWGFVCMRVQVIWGGGVGGYGLCRVKWYVLV